MCILFGHESWVNCTRFQKICPLSLLGQTSHTVLWWQGTFCSVCGRSLLQDGAMCREVGRMACHRCLVGKHDKVMSCFYFFCILRESNRLLLINFDVQNHKEISEIQSDSQPVLSQQDDFDIFWPGLDELHSRCHLEGRWYQKRPQARQLETWVSWSQHLRGTGDKSFHQWSDSLILSARHAGPSSQKKNNEVYTASTRHWTSKIFMSEKGGKLWPEINHEELELPSFLSRAKWHPVTRNHQMHRAMAARSCGQVGYIKWYFNTSSNLPTSKLTIATIIYDNLTIAMITIYSCHNPWSDCKWLRSRTRVYIAAWYIKKIVQSTCINRWSSNPQDPLNPL